ncbi:MAG TPA: class I SAM-dependent methyltransferase [Lentisphaeria bacterium]|nr:class I SAM-dependent methyltransferase [Lentisphaeria bacterium]
MPKRLILHKERHRSLLRGHPWIFSGAVAQVIGEPGAGDTVDVMSADGEWLAKAAYCPNSQIRARVWTFTENEAVDASFFQRRLQAAAAYRSQLGLANITNAWRVVHAEADGLPGCIIDKYDDFLVCQFLNAGAEAWRHDIIAAALEAHPETIGVYERSDTDSRAREALPERCGLLRGQAPPATLVIQENGIKLLVDVRTGHKTGFYLDQRDNRALEPDSFRQGDVLNCFCYSGGFGLRAAKAGASRVVQVDAAEPALTLARLNAEANGLDTALFEYKQGDVFQILRAFRDSRRDFSCIILDPPKFADTPGQLPKACRGYKDINLLAAKLLRPGGVLLTFSCSGAMTPELFQKVVGDAVRDAGRDARIVRALGQAPDHPVSLNFPEGRYLTGLQLIIP